jgi:chromosomal replication initiation ATPase DnaA
MPDLTLAQIVAATARVAGCTTAEVKSPRRSRDVAIPRLAGMVIAHATGRWSLTTIARAFGRADHTTVVHAASRADDPDVSAARERIEQDLQEAPPDTNPETAAVIEATKALIAAVEALQRRAG